MAGDGATVRPSWWRRRGACAFAAIVAGAFLVRLVYLVQAAGCPLFPHLFMDGSSYGAWSDRIAAGEWIGTTVFYQAPGYPYFLGLVKLLVGADLWSIRLVQIALGALSCGVLFLAGRTVFSFGAGVAAGVMLAVYPPAVFYDTLIQKAGLGLAWMVLLLWALARLARGVGRWGTALGAGASLGLLILTREETMLLVPILFAWLMLGLRTDPWRRRAARAGVWGAGLAAVLLPVMARNYHVGGELQITTSQAGTNFYIGNNPGATGVYAPLRPGRSDPAYERTDAVELAELASGRNLTPGEVSRFWFGRAFEFIGAQPGAWASLMGRKAALLVNWYEVPDYEDLYFYARFAPVLSVARRVWHMGVLVPLALLGLVLTRRRPGVGVLWVVLATLAVGVVLFFVFGRYRYTLVPGLMLLAGAGVVEAGVLVRAGAWRALALGGAVAVGGAVAANLSLLRPADQLAASYANAGAVTPDPERGLVLLREALRLNPGYVEARLAMALKLAALGLLHDAIGALREVAVLRPEDARVRHHLGTLLAEIGDLSGAEQELARAVALGPTDLDSRLNYMEVLGQREKYGPSLEQMRAALALRPDDPQILGNLSWMLSTCPDAALRDAAGALDFAERALAVAGERADTLDILGVALSRVGRFTEAARAAERGATIARGAGLEELAAEIAARLALYRANRAFGPAP